MRRPLWIALLALTGCASASTPGKNVSEMTATRWGCSHPWVMERAEYLKEDLPRRHVYIPQAGWSVCDLLAAVGKPMRIDRAYTENSRSMGWWYQDGYIRLTYNKRLYKWIVTYVGW